MFLPALCEQIIQGARPKELSRLTSIRYSTANAYDSEHLPSVYILTLGFGSIDSDM